MATIFHQPDHLPPFEVVWNAAFEREAAMAGRLPPPPLVRVDARRRPTAVPRRRRRVLGDVAHAAQSQIGRVLAYVDTRPIGSTFFAESVAAFTGMRPKAASGPLSRLLVEGRIAIVCWERTGRNGLRARYQVQAPGSDPKPVPPRLASVNR